MRVVVWSHEHEIVVNPDSFNFARICAVWVLRRLADIIMLQRVETSIYVGENVVFNCNVIHDSNVATLAGANGKKNRVTDLSTLPVVLQNVALDENTLRALELQVVLD